MSDLRQFYFDDLEISSDKWESYFGVYNDHIPKALHTLLQNGNRKLTFVEVGVQRGGSLEMWSRFFTDEQNAYHDILQERFEIDIIGIDVDPECANLKYDNPNVKVIIGDQGDPVFWDKFLSEHPKVDIFIDDGGHFMDQQILTFEKIFPVLTVGGTYFCEDCHTSYMPYNGGGLGRKGSFIEYAKTYVDVIHSEWFLDVETEMERKKKIGKDLTSIHFYDSMIVFDKCGKKKMKRVFPKKFEANNV